jgi:adenine-specific DNA-methyltransferase
MRKSARSVRVEAKRKIENYTYPKKKRLNNPPVGLVTAESDQDAGKKTYAYDPHLDPILQFDQQRARQTVADAFARTRATADAVRAAFDRYQKESQNKPPDAEKLERLKTELSQAMAAASEAATLLEKVQNPYLAWAGRGSHR